MMNRNGQTTITLAWTTVFFSLALIGNIGCSLAGDQILPASLEDRISSSNGTASDHRTAAHLYQLEAQRLTDEAATYVCKAESILPLEDTKGFRRDALKSAGRQRQKQAEELRQLVAEYEQKAEALTTQQRQN